MKQKLTLVILVFIVGLITSCNRKNEVPKVAELTPYRSIDHFGDTLVFGDISQISYSGDNFYFFDYAQKILLKCDKDFSYKAVLNKRGRGPEEYEYVTDFNFLNNGKLILKEEPNIFKFYDTEFNYLKDIKLNVRIRDGRFAVDNENFLYTNSLITKSPIVKSTVSGDTISSFGVQYVIQGGEFYKRNCQNRLLFKTADNKILAVGKVVPSVELYNTAGDLIFQSYIDNPGIQMNFKANEEKYKDNQNTYSELYTDVYYSDNLLFLIYWERLASSGKTECNELVIYRIESDGIKPENRFKLLSENREQGSFTSICIYDKTKLIAYCVNNSKLQFYNLK